MNKGRKKKISGASLRRSARIKKLKNNNDDSNDNNDDSNDNNDESNDNNDSSDNNDDSNNNNNNDDVKSAASKDQPVKSTAKIDAADNPGVYFWDSVIDKFKKDATQSYNEQKYEQALEKYSLLIEMEPSDAIYYGNRAACYVMLNDCENALKEAKKSVQLCPTYIKAHCRVILSAIKLHKFEEMQESVVKMREIDSSNYILKHQELALQELSVHVKNEDQAVNAKDYEKALEHVEQSLLICPQYLVFQAKKAKYLAKIGSLEESEKLAREILSKDALNSDAHYALGTCFFETNLEKSLSHFSLAFLPEQFYEEDRGDYTQVKYFIENKTIANNAYKAQKFCEARALYSAMLTNRGLNKIMKVTLWSNLAQSSYKLGHLEYCITQCGIVLNLNPNHSKTWLRRAQCYMDQQCYEEAIEDLQQALNNSNEHRDLILKQLQEAKRLLDSAQKDYHVILGIAKDASMQVVARAYKELTKIHHPDRHADATLEVKEFHEKKCKEITRAYRMLLDKRQESYGNSNAPKS